MIKQYLEVFGRYVTHLMGFFPNVAIKEKDAVVLLKNGAICVYASTADQKKVYARLCSLKDGFNTLVKELHQENCSDEIKLAAYIKFFNSASRCDISSNFAYEPVITQDGALYEQDIIQGHVENVNDSHWKPHDLIKSRRHKHALHTLIQDLKTIKVQNPDFVAPKGVEEILNSVDNAEALDETALKNALSADINEPAPNEFDAMTTSGQIKLLHRQIQQLEIAREVATRETQTTQTTTAIQSQTNTHSSSKWPYYVGFGANYLMEGVYFWGCLELIFRNLFVAEPLGDVDLSGSGTESIQLIIALIVTGITIALFQKYGKSSENRYPLEEPYTPSGVAKHVFLDHPALLRLGISLGMITLLHEFAFQKGAIFEMVGAGDLIGQCLSLITAIGLSAFAMYAVPKLATEVPGAGRLMFSNPQVQTSNASLSQRVLLN